MVRVGADAEMETLLAGGLDEVLVGANTGGLEGLGAQLLELIGDEVDAEREIVDGGTLAAEIEDANLGVGHTTVEARLGVRLETDKTCQRTRGHDIATEQNPSRQKKSLLLPIHLSTQKSSLLPSSSSKKWCCASVSRSAISKRKAAHLVLAVPVAPGGTASHCD